MNGKRILYILAALGSGAAGAMTLANTLFIQPNAVFSVKWTAFMIFMVLVGGLGTFEGPIIGAVILFLIQDLFADQGVWYLVGLGVVAILFALLLPRGLWGWVQERFGIQLMPVGYRIQGLLGLGVPSEWTTSRPTSVKTSEADTYRELRQRHAGLRPIGVPRVRTDIPAPAAHRCERRPLAARRA